MARSMRSRVRGGAGLLWLVIGVAGTAGLRPVLAQEETGTPGPSPPAAAAEPALVGADAPAGAEEAPPVEAASDAGPARVWELRVGGLYRGGMDVNVRGASAARGAAPAGGSSFQRVPGGIGSTGAYADRTYDDGFVNIDPGTADPATIVPGVTWFWGYQNDGQYSAGSQMLSFTKGGGESFSRSVTRDEAWNRSEETEAPGLALELSRDLPSLHRALSVVLGFQAFWLDDVDVTASSYEERYSRRQYEIVDRYDTSRGGPPPPAPYAGTYDGPGYLIGNRPDSRAAVTTSRADWTVRNRVELELESEMYQWTLGPRLTAPLHSRIALFADPFVSLAYVSADAAYSEELQRVAADGATATAARWQESAEEEDWIFGLGVRAGLDFGLGCGWSVGVFGGYDWIGDDVALSVGPSTIELDASGYFGGATLGKEF